MCNKKLSIYTIEDFRTCKNGLWSAPLREGGASRTVFTSSKIFKGAVPEG